MLLNLLKAHWRLLGAVLALAAAFVAGRYSAPKPQVQVKTVERVVTQTQTVKQEAEIKHDLKTLIVYRDRVSHPDGTVEVKSETRAVEGDTTQIKIDDSQLRVQTDQVAQSVTVTTPRDNWHVSIFAGSPVSLSSPDLLVGGSVERRILGPFYAGAWVLVAPLDHSPGPAGGLSLGVTF